MVETDAGSLGNLVRAFNYYPDNTVATAECVKAGISVFLDQPYVAGLKDALDKKLVTVEDIERNIKGNFRMRMRLGEFDPPEMVSYNKIAGTEEPWYGEKNKAIARKATQESIVLLKNANNLLPLDKASVKSIAVVGPLGNDVLVDWYGGIPPYTVSPLEGIKAKVGPGVRVRYIADNSNNQDAANIAKESDVVVVFIGNKPTCLGPFGGQCPPSEGKEAVDRKAIELDPAQNQLVQAMVRANPKTIVVLKSSFPYSMNAVQQAAPAILHMAHSGQEEGNGLADVLFGDYNPAGRLVVTWPKSMEDLPDMMDYDIRKGRTYMYSKAEPQYPFGYGLSYTTFEYSNLKTSADAVPGKGEITVSVDVKNTGKRAGDEVVQLYVKYQGSSVERPIKQLRGFERVTIGPNQTRTVKIPLKGIDLAYWNADKHSFVVEAGKVDILIGASSADVKVQKTVGVTP
jgi:beta-glucosidase